MLFSEKPRWLYGLPNEIGELLKCMIFSVGYLFTFATIVRILDLSALQEFVMFCIKSVSKGMFGVLIFTERLNCIPLVFLPVSTFLHWQGLDVFCPYQFCEYRAAKKFRISTDIVLYSLIS